MRRFFPRIFAFLALLTPAVFVHGQGWGHDQAPAVDIRSLPRFRGFNLLEKFTADSNRPYREEDFRLISRLGFNFVRLPLDYRCFYRSGDSQTLDERTMKEIDEAVRFGLKYHIHVCLNFHRAPGYCVNPPPEKTSLWADSGTQERFARLWGIFAERYRGVSSRDLSFNLVNEPGEVEPAVYAEVMMKAIEAVRSVDPYRLILADGVRWGQAPVTGLSGGWIIQAARGYSPMEVTHYRAGWIQGSDSWPAPSWPMPKPIPAFLYGPQKSEFHSPLVLRFRAEREIRLSVTVHQVSALSRLVVKTDGRIAFEKTFKPGPGQGEWKQSVFQKQWNIYQNVYDKTYSAVVPAGTSEVSIENTEGDWLTLSEIRIEPYGAKVRRAVVLSAADTAWGRKQEMVRLDETGRVLRDGGGAYDRRWLEEVQFAPWIKLQKRGGSVMIGECGVYSRTPHETALAFLEDILIVAKEHGWGWALWNFRGDFGILDSNRADVAYENFEGHKLDRKMLKLLLKY
ncbi:MAG: cellulase family glycosylhydrolase [Spirochaetales bacterium]|nr:cellulase family glycosylhydrolase [Spirochaetales bacterium]